MFGETHPGRHELGIREEVGLSFLKEFASRRALGLERPARLNASTLLNFFASDTVKSNYDPVAAMVQHRQLASIEG